MNAPLRRGACPGLSAPMQTGDGLLVRLRPVGTIALDAFAELCASARRFGNGIVEVTARGSIQVRGLSEASAPRFAAAVAALGIAAEEGVALHVNPLAGLDPDELFDAGALAAELRRALARTDLAARLSPKVSVAIDGGGALTLDALSADVRLQAEQGNDTANFRVSVGGDHAHAGQLGVVTPEHGIEAALRLLEAIARHGREARAREVLTAEGTPAFAATIADLVPASNGLSCRDKPGHDGPERRREIIGKHRLRDRLFAYGVAVAFGHAEALALEELFNTAAAAGSKGMRTAAGRALIAIGLTEEAVPAFIAAAERLGFIVRADDPRRDVIACAGAPFCASGHIAARTMAPMVAKAAAQFRGGQFTVHVSGCAKGCAHPAPAALTIVGTSDGCAMIANGAPRDAPFAIVAPDQLPAAIDEAFRERVHA